MIKEDSMKIKILFLLIVTSSFVFGQKSNLYQSLQYQNALEQGTRSVDGTPGENYWINRTDYDLKVDFDPVSNLLKGDEVMTYHNNSPDTLRRLVIRLYQDFYRKGNPRDWQINADQLHDGVKISEVFVNGKEIDMDEYKRRIIRSGTNLHIKLGKENKIAPGTKNKIELKFEYTFPQFSALRMGSYDSTSSFVAHWYPQMAVYDDIDGWDMNNYYGTYEFYNDFGIFNVELTVPKNFIVWGTGVLQNPKEVLSEKYLERYQEARESDEVINIISKDDLGKMDFTKDREKLTWKFKAEMVPDFAFATSDHYLWDARSVEVEEGRRVVTSAAYKEESQDFYEVAEVSAQTVEYLSKELPGVPFPWPEVTVFNGRGGMEFPMMVNDGSAKTRDGMVGVTSHEIAHTYMPFYLGTNERKYAFMDEGWAVMLPFDFQARNMEERDPVARNHMGYSRIAGKELDLPLMVLSTQTRYIAYRNVAYGRPGAAYHILEGVLGKEKFKAALKEYINRWKEKHPLPYDFFYTFEDFTGENLEWFWKPWFFEFGYPDLAISEVFGNKIKIEKVGKLPIPIALTVIYSDNTNQIFTETAEVWKEGDKFVEFQAEEGKKIIEVKLGNTHIPDADLENNNWKK